jgi:hypothetical protein
VHSRQQQPTNNCRAEEDCAPDRCHSHRANRDTCCRDHEADEEHVEDDQRRRESVGGWVWPWRRRELCVVECRPGSWVEEDDCLVSNSFVKPYGDPGPRHTFESGITPVLQLNPVSFNVFSIFSLLLLDLPKDLSSDL